MILFRRQRVAFLHCPKTGGLALRAALERCGGRSAGGDIHADLAPERFQAVACVRHPCAWLESLWRFSQRPFGKIHVQQSPLAEFGPLLSLDFPEFVRGYLSDCPGAVGRLMDRYGGTIRQEFLAVEAAQVFGGLGITLGPLGVANVTRGGHETQWPAGLWQQVESAESGVMRHYAGIDLSAAVLPSLADVRPAPVAQFSKCEFVPEGEQFICRVCGTVRPRRVVRDCRPIRGKCRHLGADTGETRTCDTCRGKTRLKLFACAALGKCTVGRRVEGLACCDAACGAWQPLDDSVRGPSAETPD